MSTIELQPHARAERRRWLAALPSPPMQRGTTAFIVAKIGTVSYAGMSGAGSWRGLVGDLRREMWFETVALMGTVLMIGLLFYAACAAAKHLAGAERPVHEIAACFAHTLIPIAFAYAFAHYFTLVVFEGQQLIHAASNPFGRGWDLFGTATWHIVFTSSSSGCGTPRWQQSCWATSPGSCSPTIERWAISAAKLPWALSMQCWF